MSNSNENGIKNHGAKHSQYKQLQIILTSLQSKLTTLWVTHDNVFHMQIIFKFGNYRPNEIPYAQPTYAPKIRATITKKAAPIILRAAFSFSG